MTHGGNSHNRDNRARVAREVMNEGRCACCPRHDGENYGRRHGWHRGFRVEGSFTPSKRREVK